MKKILIRILVLVLVFAAAGFETINDTWVKGRGNINTVFLIIHVSGIPLR